MSNGPWYPSVPPGPAPYGYPGAAGHPGPPLATWRERFVARLIDSVVFGASMIVSTIVYVVFVHIVVASGYRDSAALVFFVVYLASWVVPGLLYGAYDYVMHAGRGQTLGKMALRIRVATVDGRLLSWRMLLRRSAVYPGVFALIGVLAWLGVRAWLSGSAVCMLLVVGLSLADGIPIITGQRLRQALHDRVAGTVVIKAA